MKLRLYGIKNCDTVKKARTALEETEHDVTFVDVKSVPLDPQTVDAWLKDVPAETLINKRGTTWRNLDDAEKQKALEAPSKAICEQPTLFKRPVIVASDGAVSVGWTKSEQDKYLA